MLRVAGAAAETGIGTAGTTADAERMTGPRRGITIGAVTGAETGAATEVAAVSLTGGGMKTVETMAGGRERKRGGGSSLHDRRRQDEGALIPAPVPAPAEAPPPPKRAVFEVSKDGKVDWSTSKWDSSASFVHSLAPSERCSCCGYGSL